MIFLYQSFWSYYGIYRDGVRDTHGQFKVFTVGVLFSFLNLVSSHKIVGFSIHSQTVSRPLQTVVKEN